MDKNKEYHFLKPLKYRVLWQSLIIGAAGGILVSLYRLLLSWAENFSGKLYASVFGDPWKIILAFCVLIVMGILIGYLTQYIPAIKGSGIPQVEGRIQGKFFSSWWKVILGKVFGGAAAIGAGLSLGREGPSIQLGAAVGEGLAQSLHRDETESRYLITCGASAGLAAAFNAPFAGVLFALEELHRNFSLHVFLPAMVSAITADLISKKFFGLTAVFGAPSITVLPLRFYFLLPLLGVLLGICGCLYNHTLLFTQHLYSKITFIKRPFVMILPFIAAGFAAMLCPDILGGGHKIVTLLLEKDLTVSYLLILLAAKFVFSMISFGSGAPGGIFFPLLVLGSLAGTLFGLGAISFFSLAPDCLSLFLFLGMVGMFTGIVRAPATGIVLIIEMSGSMNQTLSMALVALFAYLTADFLRSKPIYESLLENLISSKPKKYQLAQEKIFLEFTVEAGSFAEGKTVKELQWPYHCLAVSVLRNGCEIIPKGSLQIEAGDIITILCSGKEEDICRQKMANQLMLHS